MILFILFLVTILFIVYIRLPEDRQRISRENIKFYVLYIYEQINLILEKLKETGKREIDYLPNDLIEILKCLTKYDAVIEQLKTLSESDDQFKKVHKLILCIKNEEFVPCNLVDCEIVNKWKITKNSEIYQLTIQVLQDLFTKENNPFKFELKRILKCQCGTTELNNTSNLILQLTVPLDQDKFNINQLVEKYFENPKKVMGAKCACPSKELASDFGKPYPKAVCIRLNSCYWNGSVLKKNPNTVIISNDLKLQQTDVDNNDAKYKLLSILGKLGDGSEIVGIQFSIESGIAKIPENQYPEILFYVKEK